MNDSQNEYLLNGYSSYITIEKMTQIMNYMKKTICIIEHINGNGTGFFCKIKDKNENTIYVLITNNHIIDEDIILRDKVIKVYLNDKTSRKIEISENKKLYTSKKYDTTIIQINPEKENINDFLELDDIIYDEDLSPNLQNKTIYIIQYPGYDYYTQKAAVSFGTIINQLNESDKLEKFEILHNCSTDHGSSGSPILKLENNKVIGIHNQKMPKFNCNRGIFFRYSIKEFLDNKNIIKKNGNIESTLNQHQREIQKNMSLKRERNLEDLLMSSKFISKDNKLSKTGLKNLGNTSYLNAVLQVLGNLKNFYKYFLEKKSEEFFTNNIKECPLSFVTHRLFKHLYPDIENKEREIYEPSGFLRVLSSINNIYNDTNSKNPNELISLILRTLNNEINKASNNTHSKNNSNTFDKKDRNIVINEGILEFISMNDSIISDSLSWFKIKESQCNNCCKIWYDFLNDYTFKLDILGCYNKINKKKYFYL